MSATHESLSKAAPADTTPTTHPKGFFFIFWGEFAERCSYYGMRTILPLYLTGVLHFGDNNPAYFYFKMACYFLPLLGGYLADRFFGKYWTIVGFSVPYVLGHFVLGIENEVALVIALFLLAGGSGVIKPNISTLMGLTYDQQRPGQEKLRSDAFLWFYYAINVGATLSMYGLPELRDYLALEPGKTDLTQADPAKLSFAYKVAFQIPAWLMVAALAAFALGKPYYAVERAGPAPGTTPEERRQRWQTLSSLFGLFGLITVFWVAYEHNDNLWVYFARDHVDLTLDVGLFQWTRPPDGYQVLNGLLILILVPLFGWFFRKVDPDAKVFKPTFKILLGLFWTAAAAGLMALAAYRAGQTGAKVSAWWIVAAYFVLTVGEILVYLTGLELAYTVAPARMKGFVTACFLVTNGLGNLINAQILGKYFTTKLSPGPFFSLIDVEEVRDGVVTHSTRLPPGPFFALTAAITLAAAVACYFVGRRFDRDQASRAGVPA